MANLPTKSQIQFEHRPDGTVGLVGRPDVVLRVHQDQAHADFPAWERELGLPQYQEQWDALAEGTGVINLSCRFMRFILADESPTKHAGNQPLQPAHIRFDPTARYPLILGHRQYVIGACSLLMLHPKESREDVPDFVKGDCVGGIAELYDTPLADIAWRGLERNIFSHMCAVLNQKPEDPDGAGDLVEIALVSEAEAACPGARVLKTWEA
jgi:hypothetical protein